jgi:hypothetical protein
MGYNLCIIWKLSIKKYITVLLASWYALLNDRYLTISIFTYTLIYSSIYFVTFFNTIPIQEPLKHKKAVSLTGLCFYLELHSPKGLFLMDFSLRLNQNYWSICPRTVYHWSISSFIYSYIIDRVCIIYWLFHSWFHQLKILIPMNHKNPRTKSLTPAESSFQARFSELVMRSLFNWPSVAPG